MNLKNKVAFINGGARIGKVVAQHLASKGCDIVLTYRHSKKAAEETGQSVEERGRRTLILKGDMSKTADVKKCVKRIISFYGRLDVVVNMASVYKKTKWKDLNGEVWDKNLNANAKSAYMVVLEASSHLLKAGGRVINFSDWICVSGRPRYKDYVPYYSSKTALMGLTQAQALELAPRVLVNAIAPGPILPPAGLSSKELDEVKKQTPLARWGGADEIAKAVIFLCETDFVTGECLRVDGGRHLL